MPRRTRFPLLLLAVAVWCTSVSAEAPKDASKKCKECDRSETETPELPKFTTKLGRCWANVQSIPMQILFRRKVRSLDCPLAAQSSRTNDPTLEGSERDHFQPQHRQGF